MNQKNLIVKATFIVFAFWWTVCNLYTLITDRKWFWESIPLMAHSLYQNVAGFFVGIAFTASLIFLVRTVALNRLQPGSFNGVTSSIGPVPILAPPAKRVKTKDFLSIESERVKQCIEANKANQSNEEHAIPKTSEPQSEAHGAAAPTPANRADVKDEVQGRIYGADLDEDGNYPEDPDEDSIEWADLSEEVMQNAFKTTDLNELGELGLAASGEALVHATEAPIDGVDPDLLASPEKCSLGADGLELVADGIPVISNSGESDLVATSERCRESDPADQAVPADSTGKPKESSIEPSGIPLSHDCGVAIQDVPKDPVSNYKKTSARRS
ncbi:hypothetical protein [Noviherbaspirillum pedocola]|uniref:Uncharacterized protein n=1 Tax=Noviherbaspirillum pedocola TaxID=2801341 RepID=A0A934T197_9BURK|nr:hypothetical protein [Noviherbaspirillum pedocola]MBK4738921.1 hypothetical protein [Noviherbaspirillum pedocola]